jgi:dehydrogenase/reductase SDR family member 7B
LRQTKKQAMDTGDKEKVVIITGASSGIGRALALEALKRGYRVVLAARRLYELKGLISQAGAGSEQALAVETDVSDKQSCKDMVATALQHFGRIDVLINNAGISMRAIFEDTDVSVLERLMQVNFWGSVYCTKYALPALLESKGSVVGVSSVAGFKGLPARTGYSASKFALQGFLEALRVENLKKGLHVLIACPGFTSSQIRQTALSKDGSAQGESPRDEVQMMSAGQVAVYILDAVQKRKNSLVLTRQGKMTLWLNKFFPSLVDKLVYKHMAREVDSPFT